MLALDPRVVGAAWAAVEAMLPIRPPDEHPLGCHRPRIPDRECFEGILFRLVTGCSWDVAGRLGKGGETTLRNRCNEWIAAGVFDRLAEEALAAYDRVVGLDLGDVALDGSQHKAPMGGEGTGPNPTDRGKSGWKWSVLTDRWGIPLGWASDGANRNDCVLFGPTLDAVAARGLLDDVETLHLDRGYDNGVVRARGAELGLHDVVCAKRRPRGAGKVKKVLPLGMRWPVERTNQLAVQLRPAPPQHRPHRRPAPWSVRPRRGPGAHRQAGEVG
jgi:transposase